MMRCLFVLTVVGGLAVEAQSDEGMWLLDEPPKALLKSKYSFELTDAWLTKARAASVRFNNGGSGSFVSPDGLVITNHHIGADSLQKLSTPEKNYYRDGYYAAKRADELKCPDLELNVLSEIVDVTGRVNAAVKPGLSDADAFAARSAEIARVEKESLAETGLRSDVVTLYQGGLYHLYRYKRYTDVRLVFAPEEDIAFFGGDVDNFEYPRFCLDVSFFRVYEDGKPVRGDQYFRWSREGAKDGDLVFVTGHPGTTNRLETLAKLRHRRDVTLPYTLAYVRSQEALLREFGERSPENARTASLLLHRFANARKAYGGMYMGLLDPAVMRRKLAEETALFDAAAAKLPADEVAAGRQALGRIAHAQKRLAEFEEPYSLYERGHAFESDLFDLARDIVRLADELGKPNGQRLAEYRDSRLESLKLRLDSPAPIYADLERARLGRSLSFLAERLGGDHPLVVKALGGKGVAARAAELVNGTKLADPGVRRSLVEGGVKAVDDSRDAMIRFARLVDADARRLRDRFEDQVEEPQRQAYSALSGVRFKVYGKGVPPDATFTLRLAFGVVKGYAEGGDEVPFRTTFGGAFGRADAVGGREPFNLPQRWRDGKAGLDLSTPFDFVSTADTIGGNSGSPVLNRAGEFVGINFDRNRHGLVRNFVYTEEQARHISVHSRAIIEALKKLYNCPELVREILGEG